MINKCEDQWTMKSERSEVVAAIARINSSLNNKIINECIPSGDDLTQLSRSHAVPIKSTISTTATNKIK